LSDKTVHSIEMDAEGAEPFLIEGMIDWISRAKEILIVTAFNPSASCLNGHALEKFLNTQYDKFEVVHLIDELSSGLTIPSGTSLAAKISEWYAVNLLCRKGVNL